MTTQGEHRKTVTVLFCDLALGQALERYERKGSLASAERTRARLVELAAIA